MKRTTSKQAEIKIKKAYQLLTQIKQPVLYDNYRFYEIWERTLEDLDICLIELKKGENIFQ